MSSVATGVSSALRVVITCGLAAEECGGRQLAAVARDDRLGSAGETADGLGGWDLRSLVEHDDIEDASVRWDHLGGEHR